MPIASASRKNRQVVIVFNDISENKRAEAALRESEARFRSTMDNMLEGCQILDRQWRYVYINDAAERQNRRPRAELMGKRYMDIWPGIESTHVFDVIRRCLEERKGRDLGERVRLSRTGPSDGST